MTRIRVLMKAIKLLESGFIPYDYRSQAQDKAGNHVSYVHPDATRFTATGAVVRAIYDLTGDPAAERDGLWTDTMIEFKRQFGDHWTSMYDAFERMSKDEVLELFKNKLAEWNR